MDRCDGNTLLQNLVGFLVDGGKMTPEGPLLTALSPSGQDSATNVPPSPTACHPRGTGVQRRTPRGVGDMTAPTMLHRLAAEFIGTFWLVLGGCGSAVFAAKFPSDGTALGIGFLGVALAFGLTVLTGVYAFGTISGGHFNPAVTLGAAIAKRVEWRVLPAYWVTQVVGGVVAGLVIYVIAKGKEGWSAEGNMAANGFGEHSPGNYSMVAV